MSIKIMSRVWEESKSKGGELLVLLALADHCDDEGVCYPGIARIAKKSRLSVRQTQSHMDKLEKEGALVRKFGGGLKVRGERGMGHTTKYTLLFPPKTKDASSIGVKSAAPQSPLNWGEVSAGIGVKFPPNWGEVSGPIGVKPTAPKPSEGIVSRNISESSDSPQASPAESLAAHNRGFSSPNGGRLPPEAFKSVESRSHAAKGGDQTEGVSFCGVGRDGEL